MATQNEIDNWFMYHPPTPGQLEAYNDIRQAAKVYAQVVNKYVPDSADKTVAIRKIRESVMAANLAVACNWPAVEITGPAIPPHQQRVLAEKKALDENIDKLDIFRSGAFFQTLPTEEQNRLNIQLSQMRAYSGTLADRIAAF